MILAIDAGNTRIKWGIFNAAGKLVLADACFHDALPDINFSHAPAITKVIISNVAGESIANALSTKLAASNLDNIEVMWLSSTDQAGSLTNDYAEPETLGTDRWAALVGAWQSVQQSCVVVNMGTTITIDLINASPNTAVKAKEKGENNGVFVGGTIVPGLYMMANSLNANTAQLPNIQTHIAAQITVPMEGQLNVGRNTSEAISHGIINAALGAIREAVASLSTMSQVKPVLLLTGGDAKKVSNQLVHINAENSAIKQMLIDENLVLLGLFHLSHP